MDSKAITLPAQTLGDGTSTGGLSIFARGWNGYHAELLRMNPGLLAKDHNLDTSRAYHDGCGYLAARGPTSLERDMVRGDPDAVCPPEAESTGKMACPYCENVDAEEHGTQSRAYVSCSVCGMEGPSFPSDEEGLDRAIAAWNEIASWKKGSSHAP